MRSVLGCLALLTLTGGIVVAQEKIDFSKLPGKWELAESKKGSVSLEFVKDNKITVVVGEAGKETKLEGTYRTYDENKMEVTLRFMTEDLKEQLVVKKLTADELITEDSKGKVETFKKKK